MSRASLGTLFNFEPASVAAVFGGPQGVALGLRTLISQLESPQQRDLEIAQYVIATIHLADKMRKSGQLDPLADELLQVKKKIEEFDLPRPTRIAQVEHIYQQHVSTVQPQIMVRGEPLHLQKHIRAMLLAGIRSAVLWRQCGGKKLQLLFSRNKVTAIARAILDRTGND